MPADELYNKQEDTFQEENYLSGLKAMEDLEYQAAVEWFQKIPGYKNADALFEEAGQKLIQARMEAISQMKAKRQEAVISEAAVADKTKKVKVTLRVLQRWFIIVCAACLLAYIGDVSYLKITCYETEKASYQQAVKLLQAGKPFEAAASFNLAWGYRDAAQKSTLISDYLKEVVSAGGSHTAAVKADGTVMAVGSDSKGQCKVLDWKDITAVAAGYDCTVALKKDGTATVVGNNSGGQLDLQGWQDVAQQKQEPLLHEPINFNFGDGSNKHWYLCDWKDIVSISASDDHVVGLKKDGTVVAVGRNDYGQCRVFDWSNIIAISAGEGFTIGLRSDGTVVAAGSNTCGQCTVSYWRDIVSVSAGNNHTVGLRKNGTVIAVGKFASGQCDVEKWKNIVDVSAGNDFTIGLCKDGTVVACGSNGEGRGNVSGWKDMIAVYTGDRHTIGLRKDGTLVATGDNSNGQCNVGKWSGISQNIPMNSIIPGLDKSGFPTYPAWCGGYFLGAVSFMPWGR